QTLQQLSTGQAEYRRRTREPGSVDLTASIQRLSAPLPSPTRREGCPLSVSNQLTVLSSRSDMATIISSHSSRATIMNSIHSVGVSGSHPSISSRLLMASLQQSNTNRLSETHHIDKWARCLPPSPPAEKASTSEDQAGKSGTGDGA